MGWPKGPAARGAPHGSAAGSASSFPVAAEGPSRQMLTGGQKTSNSQMVKAWRDTKTRKGVGGGATALCDSEGRKAPPLRVAVRRRRPVSVPSVSRPARSPLGAHLHRPPRTLAEASVAVTVSQQRRDPRATSSLIRRRRPPPETSERGVPSGRSAGGHPPPPAVAAARGGGPANVAVAGRCLHSEPERAAGPRIVWAPGGMADDGGRPVWAGGGGAGTAV